MVLGGLEEVKFKNKVNGSGQECPLHTNTLSGKGHGHF